MAFNLLVELKSEKVDWKKLSNMLVDRPSKALEFFPIPDFGKTGKDYIGISVLKNNFLKEEIPVLIRTISILINEGHSVFELYSSNEFTNHNIDILINRFLK